MKVACDREGRPLSLIWRGRRQGVTAVRDLWRIDDEWWRRPIHRLYYLVELEDGRLDVLFCDLETGAWYRQRESVPLYAPGGLAFPHPAVDVDDAPAGRGRYADDAGLR
ncbi:MAG: hypothetical protein LOD85_06380 [Clostridia bacterium]